MDTTWVAVWDLLDLAAQAFQCARPYIRCRSICVSDQPDVPFDESWSGVGGSGDSVFIFVTCIHPGHRYLRVLVAPCSCLEEVCNSFGCNSRHLFRPGNCWQWTNVVPHAGPL